MTKRKHWKEIEILYSIGIVLVLIGHSHSSDWSTFEGTPLYYVIQFIYTFHMPLFFFIAGFLFMNSSSLERVGLKKWLGDKALRLLVPYAFWTLIALVPKYYFENHGMSSFNAKYVLNVILCPRLGVWGHFWFLPVMFFTYVIFAISRKLIKSDFAFFAIMLISSIIIYFIHIKTLLLGLADLRNVLIFFSLGLLLNNILNKRNLDRFVGSKVICFSLGAVCAAISIFLVFAVENNRIVSIATAILMIICCFAISEIMSTNKITDWLNNNNFTVYIFSWLFQSVMMSICDRFQFVWWITFILMFFIGIIGSLLTVLIYDFIRSKIPIFDSKFFKLIFGTRVHDKVIQ